MQQEHNYLKNIIQPCVDILVICIILTIIKYFTEEVGQAGNVSEIVLFFSMIVIFIIVIKDLNFIKDLLKQEYDKFNIVSLRVPQG